MYKEKRRGDTKPHIFAISDIAFHDMLQMRENQSILITFVLPSYNTDTVIPGENQVQGKLKTQRKLSSISLPSLLARGM
jgi:hypothetical protein